jgi:hypothetical protein
MRDEREKIEEFLAGAERDFAALKIASPWDTRKPFDLVAMVRAMLALADQLKHEASIYVGGDDDSIDESLVDAADRIERRLAEVLKLEAVS